MATNADLGPLLRLSGLPHTSLPSPTAPPAAVAPLLETLLREAVPFADSVANKRPPRPSMVAPPPYTWRGRGAKTYPECATKVHLLERSVSANELARISGTQREHDKDGGKRRPEIWACRLSYHRDAPEKGTATYEELRRAFRDQHAETEEATTAEVVEMREALAWPEALLREIELEVPESGHGHEGSERWRATEMHVIEAKHRLALGLLEERVFVSLQVSFQLLRPRDVKGKGREGDERGPDEEEEREFLRVSVDLPDFEGHKAAGLCKANGEKMVRGAYTSVERIRKVVNENGAGEEHEGKIEWIMATVSDARGNLPGWMQKAAVPGQIAKDVPLFMGWIHQQRTSDPASLGGRPLSKASSSKSSSKQEEKRVKKEADKRARKEEKDLKEEGKRQMDEEKKALAQTKKEEKDMEKKVRELDRRREKDERRRAKETRKSMGSRASGRASILGSLEFGRKSMDFGRKGLDFMRRKSTDLGGRSRPTTGYGSIAGEDGIPDVPLLPGAKGVVT